VDFITNAADYPLGFRMSFLVFCAVYTIVKSSV